MRDVSHRYMMRGVSHVSLVLVRGSSLVHVMSEITAGRDRIERRPSHVRESW